jgi:hypothetical protein
VANRPIRLTIDTFTTELRRFTPTGYDVKVTASGDVEYSLFGSVVDGPAFEEKRIWTISAYIDLAAKQALWRIYKRSEAKRRAAPTDFSILVEDYITPFIEDGSTRTRGLATSGTVVTDSGGISYPAKYYARMFEPTFVEYDYRGLHLCSFVLKELDRVAP